MKLKKQIKILLFLLVLGFTFSFSNPTYAAPKISASKVTLKVGMSQKLSVQDTRMKPKWTSSNSKIVKVNSVGRVVALRKGTAVVTGQIGSKKYKSVIKVTGSNVFKPKAKSFKKYDYRGTVIFTPTKVWYGSDGDIHVSMKLTNTSYKAYKKYIYDLYITITANPKNGKPVNIAGGTIFSDKYDAEWVSLAGHRSKTIEIVIPRNKKNAVDFSKMKSIDYYYSYDEGTEEDLFGDYDDDDDDDDDDWYDDDDDDDDDDWDYDDYDDDDWY